MPIRLGGPGTIVEMLDESQAKDKVHKHKNGIFFFFLGGVGVWHA